MRDMCGRPRTAALSCALLMLAAAGAAAQDDGYIYKDWIVAYDDEFVRFVERGFPGHGTVEEAIDSIVGPSRRYHLDNMELRPARIQYLRLSSPGHTGQNAMWRYLERLKAAVPNAELDRRDAAIVIWLVSRRMGDCGTDTCRVGIAYQGGRHAVVDVSSEWRFLQGAGFTTAHEIGHLWQDPGEEAHHPNSDPANARRCALRARDHVVFYCPSHSQRMNTNILNRFARRGPMRSLSGSTYHRMGSRMVGAEIGAAAKVAVDESAGGIAHGDIGAGALLMGANLTVYGTDAEARVGPDLSNRLRVVVAGLTLVNRVSRGDLISLNLAPQSYPFFRFRSPTIYIYGVPCSLYAEAGVYRAGRFCVGATALDRAEVGCGFTGSAYGLVEAGVRFWKIFIGISAEFDFLKAQLTEQAQATLGEGVRGQAILRVTSGEINIVARVRIKIWFVKIRFSIRLVHIPGATLYQGELMRP